MKKIILSLLAAYLCLSCSNNTEQESAKRTLLVYIAADNNLIRQARKNIEAMLAAKIPSEYNLLVYIDSPSDNPYLLFDFEDYLEHIISNESDLIALRKQISRAVIYNDFTPYFWMSFPLKRVAG